MFEVLWLETALDTLADIYVAADPSERDRIARGVDSLNRQLADQPLDVGESRGETLRLAFPDLLAVRFRVDSDAGIVRVVGVGRFGR